MEHNVSCKIKTGNNADEILSDMKRIIPEEFPLAITLLYSTYSIKKRAEES
jgi:hypothetical protein